MNAQVLEPNSFSRERVKSRMLRRAAELWGYTEADLDSFDPLVALLVEACAVEFEHISTEITDTQNRLLDRLAQLLHPEPDVARPAFGLAQVRSVEPRSMVQPTTQLLFKRTGAGRYDSGGPAVGQEIFFSPVSSFPVVDGALRYIATRQALFRLEEGSQKIPVAQLNTVSAAMAKPYQSLWLGLELHEDIPSLEGLIFFLDWPNDPQRATWLQLVPFCQWKLGDKPLRLRTGLPENALSGGSSVTLEAEFNPVYKVEKQVLSTWDNSFFTVQQAPALHDVVAARQPYPPEFGQLFMDRELRTLKEPLWWVEVQFPHIINPEALSGIVGGLNCFPVMNRRLHRLTYRLQQNLNIIPLETDRSFLAVREVSTSQNGRLSAIPLGNLLELDVHTYTVQYGVSRFDDRNARQVLTNLQDLVRDESASFAALGEDFLSSVLRELNQTIARLEAKVDQKTQKRDPIPYLIIKPKQPGENVFIEYWTCNGEAANRLSPGSRLTPYADTSLRKENCLLLTTTAGGRERPKDSEKINTYKRALLSRNRIVTLEDVRVACRAELGANIVSVKAERAFRVDAVPTNGFQRCIRVSLQPALRSSYTVQEWAQRAEQLRVSLESQSVAGIPYEVVVLPA
ncbi:hypothetical protein GCM10023187_02090 [Nibrella viscosa]|uniref:Type VI secretion system protein ImpG n=1 Tax=Nibrella viscosa TaxID=1084524 RepID=A0ABP8JSF8_9BACT